MKHRWMRSLSVWISAIFWMNQILPSAYAASMLRAAATDESRFEAQLQTDTGWVWGPSGNVEAFGRANLANLGREIVSGAQAEHRVFSLAGDNVGASIEEQVESYSSQGYQPLMGSPLAEDEKQNLIERLRRAKGLLDAIVNDPVTVEVNGRQQVVVPAEALSFDVVIDAGNSPYLVGVGLEGAVHLALVAYAEAATEDSQGRILLSLEQVLGLADSGTEGLQALRWKIEHEVRDAFRGYHVDEPVEVRNFVNAQIAQVIQRFEQAQPSDRTQALTHRMEATAVKARGLVKEREHEMVFTGIARYFDGVIPGDRLESIRQRLIESLPTGQPSPVNSPYVRQRGDDLVVSVLYNGLEESAVVAHHVMTIVQQVLSGPAPSEVMAIRQKYQDEYSVSVRLGGNNIAVGLVNRAGDVENRTAPLEFNWRRAFFGEGEGVNEKILALAQQPGEEANQVANDIVAEAVRHICWVIETTGLPLNNLRHVHVSFPGPVNQAQGLVGDPFPAPNVPGFDRYPIVDQVQRLLAAEMGVAVPVFVENDADAGHRGETSAGGTAVGIQNVATLIWGTGIDGRGENQGRLLTSEGWDEIGHTIVGHLDEQGRAHYEFRGFELKGERPQLREGEFEVEQRLGGEALKARFQALGWRDAQHVSEVAGSPAVSHALAHRAIIDVGQEMGRALAALLQPFIEVSGFVPERFILTSGVAENFAVGLKDSKGRDLLIGAIQDAVFTELYVRYGTDMSISRKIADSIQRSMMDYRREFSGSAAWFSPVGERPNGIVSLRDATGEPVHFSAGGIIDARDWEFVPGKPGQIREKANPSIFADRQPDGTFAVASGGMMGQEKQAMKALDWGDLFEVFHHINDPRGINGKLFDFIPRVGETEVSIHPHEQILIQGKMIETWRAIGPMDASAEDIVRAVLEQTELPESIRQSFIDLAKAKAPHLLTQSDESNVTPQPVSGGLAEEGEQGKKVDLNRTIAILGQLPQVRRSQKIKQQATVRELLQEEPKADEELLVVRANGPVWSVSTQDLLLNPGDVLVVVRRGMSPEELSRALAQWQARQAMLDLFHGDLASITEKIVMIQSAKSREQVSVRYRDRYRILIVMSSDISPQEMTQKVIDFLSEPLRQEFVKRVTEKAPFLLGHGGVLSDADASATEAAETAGFEALSLWELEQRVSQPRVYEPAAQELGRRGHEAMNTVPTLMRTAISIGDTKHMGALLDALQRIDPDAAKAITHLRIFYDPKAGWHQREVAIRALGELPNVSLWAMDVILPAIQSALEDSNHLIALSGIQAANQLGTRAEALAPILRRLTLSDHEEAFRLAASNAVRKVDPWGRTVLSVSGGMSNEDAAAIGQATMAGQAKAAGKSFERRGDWELVFNLVTRYALPFTEGGFKFAVLRPGGGLHVSYEKLPESEPHLGMFQLTVEAGEDVAPEDILREVIAKLPQEASARFAEVVQRQAPHLLTQADGSNVMPQLADLAKRHGLSVPPEMPPSVSGGLDDTDLKETEAVPAVQGVGSTQAKRDGKALAQRQGTLLIGLVDFVRLLSEEVILPEEGVTVSGLTGLLRTVYQTSEATIRRELNGLAALGLLTRVNADNSNRIPYRYRPVPWLVEAIERDPDTLKGHILKLNGLDIPELPPLESKRLQDRKRREAAFADVETLRNTLSHLDLLRDDSGEKKPDVSAQAPETLRALSNLPIDEQIRALGLDPQEPMISSALLAGQFGEVLDYTPTPEETSQAADTREHRWVVIHSSVLTDSPAAAITLGRIRKALTDSLEGGPSALHFILAVQSATNPERAEALAEAIVAKLPDASGEVARLTRDNFSMVVPAQMDADELVGRIRSLGSSFHGSRIVNVIGPEAFAETIQEASRGTEQPQAEVIALEPAGSAQVTSNAQAIVLAIKRALAPASVSQENLQVLLSRQLAEGIFEIKARPVIAQVRSRIRAYQAAMSDV